MYLHALVLVLVSLPYTCTCARTCRFSGFHRVHRAFYVVRRTQILIIYLFLQIAVHCIAACRVFRVVLCVFSVRARTRHEHSQQPTADNNGQQSTINNRWQENTQHSASIPGDQTRSRSLPASPSRHNLNVTTCG